MHAAVVLNAVVVLGMLAVADGASCTNTFSGLTQCAVLNGQTTNANTAVMRNTELFWLDYTYEQPLRPDTNTLECRAAFNSFYCVNWAYGAGAGPCSSDGQAQPPCFSLCADWVQKCFQRMPNRESLEGRTTVFSTGAVNGAETGMQDVILTLDAAGMHNVDAICSRLAAPQNVTKCFGAVTNFTRRTCTHTFSNLTTCAVLNGEPIDVEPNAVLRRDIELLKVSNPWNEQMHAYGTRTEECRAAYNSFYCVHWAHKFGAGPCKNGTATWPCFSLCADYVQKCFPPRWPDEREHWVTFRPGVGLHGLSMESTEVRIDIPGTDNVDVICSVLGTPRNATNCFGDVASFTRLPPATSPPSATPPPPFTPQVSARVPPPDSAASKRGHSQTTWLVTVAALTVAVRVTF
jgi:hypothetical protein